MTHLQTMRPLRGHLLKGLLLTIAFAMTACGGMQERVDKESIRANADDADRDLDRESAKTPD